MNTLRRWFSPKPLPVASPAPKRAAPVAPPTTPWRPPATFAEVQRDPDFRAQLGARSTGGQYKYWFRYDILHRGGVEDAYFHNTWKELFCWEADRPHCLIVMKVRDGLEGTRPYCRGMELVPRTAGQPVQSAPIHVKEIVDVRRAIFALDRVANRRMDAWHAAMTHAYAPTSIIHDVDKLAILKPFDSPEALLKNLLEAWTARPEETQLRATALRLLAQNKTIAEVIACFEAMAPLDTAVTQ
jgi:hypothetical protein